MLFRCRVNVNRTHYISGLLRLKSRFGVGIGKRAEVFEGKAEFRRKRSLFKTKVYQTKKLIGDREKKVIEDNRVAN